MRCAAGVAVLVVACLVAPPSLRADDDPADDLRADDTPPVTLTVNGGRVSLEARDAPLPAILDEIGQRTGAHVQVDKTAGAQLEGETVTLTLRDVPVEDALRQLLRGRDFVLVVSSPGRPAEAHVYGRSGQAGAPPPAASVSSAPAGEPVDRASVAALRDRALTDPDPGARARALEGLAASADQRAARDAMLEVLERESNPGLLQRALDIVGADRTIPLEPLVNLALGNPAPEVRIKALTQLGAQVARDPRARQTLEASAANDPAPGVRDAARALLQQFNAP